jgi:hypothetical protein
MQRDELFSSAKGSATRKPNDCRRHQLPLARIHRVGSNVTSSVMQRSLVRVCFVAQESEISDGMVADMRDDALIAAEILGCLAIATLHALELDICRSAESRACLRILQERGTGGSEEPRCSVGSFTMHAILSAILGAMARDQAAQITLGLESHRAIEVESEWQHNAFGCQ